MKITSNANKLAEQLAEFEIVMKRKLENMVVEFATDIAEAASANTPKGDAASIINNKSYYDYYKQRMQDYGLPMEVGFHKGNWQYSEIPEFNFDRRIYSPIEMKNNTYGEASSSYKLGDTFYIGASGPAYIQLEHGLSAQAPDGISRPTIQMIMTAYSADLQRYYREG